ncbi:Uncharacterised protein [Enterobacter hormaechei]|nr:Uncharacterised protein [Enterobacter hormaechei]
MRIMELHCKKLELEVPLALSMIASRCAWVIGSSVKWRMERWERSRSMVGVILSLFVLRKTYGSQYRQ